MAQAKVRKANKLGGTAAILEKEEKINSTSQLSENRFAVPRFLAKAYEIFSDDQLDDVCGWNEAGDTIIIKKVADFTKEILPKFFKHNNFQSFIRQLNMYGFHKTIIDPSRREFKHQNFRRGHPDLLILIKRKVHQNDILSKHRNQFGEVLKELNDLKGRNIEMENRLKQVEKKTEIVTEENRLLWQSLHTSNERQAFMQQKLERIMQFMYKIFVKKSNELQYPRGKDELGVPDEFGNSAILTRNQLMDLIRVLSMGNPGSARLRNVEENIGNTRNDLLPLHKRKFNELSDSSDLETFPQEKSFVCDSIPLTTTGTTTTTTPITAALDPPLSLLIENSTSSSPSSQKNMNNKKNKNNINEKNNTSTLALDPPLSLLNEDIVSSKEKNSPLENEKEMEIQEEENELATAPALSLLGEQKARENEVLQKLDDLQGGLCDVFDEADFDDLLHLDFE